MTSTIVGRLLAYLSRHSAMENHVNVSWVVSKPRSPVPALLHLLALQLRPSWLASFESAGASALHITLPFGFSPGNARDRGLNGRGVC